MSTTNRNHEEEYIRKVFFAIVKSLVKILEYFPGSQAMGRTQAKRLVLNTFRSILQEDTT